MDPSGQHQDGEIAQRAVRLVIDRYGPHLHPDRNAEIFDLSLLGPKALDHEAFHSGIDYSTDPLVAVAFIREQRKLGVAVARLLYWARHPEIDHAGVPDSAPVAEGIAELLTQKVVPALNFAPKHRETLARFDDLLDGGDVSLDDLLGYYFRGEGSEELSAFLLDWFGHT